jgi:hypothetical protein
MTNPTSNFGWQMPTSTDLVTDLPADFEVFGQAVDTSLADLKGGTTNQVLAKNSDTDMDFKWVTDATGMTNPMTTTGDTIYSSSGSTPARLGIGTAGQVLKVNSGATAPEWGTAPSALTLLSTTNLTAATTTITGISQTYTNLIIEIEGISIPTAQRLNIEVRNNTSPQPIYIAGSDQTGHSVRNGVTTMDFFQTNITLTDVRNVAIIKIDNYASTTVRKGLVAYGSTNNGGAYNNLAGAIDATPAINAFRVALTAIPTAGTVRIWGM